MNNYLLFVVIAAVTVCSPGPGVMFTLSNAIRHGSAGAIGGILGIATGTFIVATIAATGLGLLLATSATAFTVMKLIGAAYLVYLGVKLWRSPARKIELVPRRGSDRGKQFFEGMLIQLTNPKAGFFFLSIFPQFINHEQDQVSQFLLLLVTYSCLVLVIHTGYAIVTSPARAWITSERSARTINRVGGVTFISFGLGLATSNR